MIQLRPNIRLLVFALIATAIIGCSGAEGRKAAHFDKGMAMFEAGDYEKARIEFRNVQQIDPKDIKGRFMMGRTLEKLGRAVPAAGRYRSVVDEDPTHLEARIALARIYIMGGGTEAGLKVIEEALVMAPDNPDALAVRGSARLLNEEIIGAREDAERALAKDPQHIDAIAVMAGVHRINKEVYKAIDILKQGIESHPEHIGLRILLSSIYAGVDDYKSAAMQSREILRLAPENLQNIRRLVHGLLADGRRGEAILELDTFIEGDSDNAAAIMYRVSLTKEEHGQDKAMAALENYVEKYPDNDDLRFGLARMYALTDQVEKSKALLQQVIETEGTAPAGLKARTALAMMYAREKDTTAALKLVEEVLAENSRDNEALMLRGRLALLAGDTDSALVDFRSVLKDRSDSAELHRLIAAVYAKRNDMELARDSLQNAAAVSDSDIRSRLALARMAMDSGDSDQAVGHLQEVLFADPKNLLALESLVQIHIRNGDPLAAMDVADKYKETNPYEFAGYYFAAGVHVVNKRFDAALAEYKKSIAVAEGNLRPVQAAVRIYAGMDRHQEALAMIDGELAGAPETAELHDIRGQILHLLDKKHAGDRAFREALRLDRKLGVAYIHLAASLYAAGDFNGSRKLLEDGRVLSPADAGRISLGLAGMLEREGMLDDAIREYGATLEADPSNILAMNNLAMLLVTGGDDADRLQRALDMAAVLEKSNNGLLHDTAGWVYFRNGDVDKALLLLASAERASPDNSEIQYHLGIVQWTKGDKAAARIHLQKAVAADAKYRGIEEARAKLAELSGS